MIAVILHRRLPFIKYLYSKKL